MADSIVDLVPGRVVHFYKWEPGRSKHRGPLAATVAAVLGPALVNLTVHEEDGHTFSRPQVPMVAEEAELPAADYCCWMPYQLEQMKKRREGG